MYLFSVSRSFVQSSLVMAAPADLSASSSAAVASPASGAVVVAPSPRPPKPKRPKQPPSFAVCKRNALSKLDKSPKGSIDAPILPLVRALYGHAGYVTTSSCSGRIALYETSGRAPNGRWALVEHRRVQLEELRQVKMKHPPLLQLRLNFLLLFPAKDFLERA